MKYINLLFGLVLLFSHQTVWAQSSPNDLHVSGYVLNSSGAAVDGQYVCVYYSGSNTTIPDSVCGYTNANGWYSIVVTNGSLIGSNQTFVVGTTDYCQNTVNYQSQQISNQQGTVDAVTISFNLVCDPSIGGGCNCQTQIVSTPTPGGAGYMFAVDVPCGTAPYSYLWSLPNGDQSSSATPTVGLTSSGTYGVCVAVADANGCSFNACDTLIVGGGSGSCDAYFYYSSTPNGNVAANTNVQFTYSGQGANTNSFVWVFTGGGASITSVQQNPVFVFPAVGIYNVCLTVSNGQGCSDTFCAPVTVVGGNSGGCQAYFEATASSTPNGHFANFSDLSSGTYTNWYWDFGDGQSSNQQNPTHYYAQPGPYLVCLTVIDSLTNLCSDYYCDSVYFDNNTGSGCIANYTYSQNPGVGSVFTFAAVAQNSQTWQYVWDFGDGSTGAGVNVTHTFPSGQNWYWVCLTAYGANGCQNTYCDTLYAGGGSGTGCTANFTFAGPSPSNAGYTFFGPQFNTPATYSWNFGDGTTGTGQSVSHQYPTAAGTYQVCLTVSITNGQTCTACQTVTIGQGNCYGYLSGQVFAGTLNQPIDNAIVYLITYDEVTQQLAAMQATVADSFGYYYFPSIPCGDYLIKAAATQNSAYYANHLPTYYGNSTFWQYAQAVSVNLTMPAVQYDIVLIAGNNPGGPGFVGGNVLQGANKVEADGEPIEGVNVMLFDLAGNAIAYTYTDANGAFEFDDLAYGSYQVYAEMLNYTTIPAVVSIGPDGPSLEGLNIFVSEDLISTGVSEVDFESLIGQVYPNPVHGLASLSINLEQGQRVSMAIVDLTGRVISSEMVNFAPGANMHGLSVDGLGSGYYMLSIREASGVFNVTRRFVVNR
jgi:PKD repeat protein